MSNTTTTQSNTETVPSYCVALFAAVEQYYNNPLSVKAVKAFKKAHKRFFKMMTIDAEGYINKDRAIPKYALDLYVRSSQYRQNPYNKECESNLSEAVDTFRDLMPIRDGIICEEPNTQ